MTAATINTTVTGLQGNPVASTAPASNQALGWNGSSWVPQGPFLPLTGGTLTGNITTTGNIRTTGGSLQSPGNAGALFNGAGNRVADAKPLVAYTGTTGWSFSSATPSMGGFGANVQYLPRVTGLMLIMFRAIAWVNQPSYTLDFGVNYGTGSPPALGAAEAGTRTAINVQVQGSTIGNSYTHFSIRGGLTVGTNYWFDTVVWANAAGQYNYVTWNVTEI